MIGLIGFMLKIGKRLKVNDNTSSDCGLRPVGAIGAYAPEEFWIYGIARAALPVRRLLSRRRRRLRLVKLSSAFSQLLTLSSSHLLFFPTSAFRLPNSSAAVICPLNSAICRLYYEPSAMRLSFLSAFRIPTSEFKCLCHLFPDT